MAVSIAELSAAPRSTGKAPSEERIHACRRLREQLLLGHVVHRPPRDRPDDERVEERAVVGGEDDRPVGDVLAPDPGQPEVEMEERLDDRADEPVDDRVGASSRGRAGAGIPAPYEAIHLLRDERYSRRMGPVATRTLRGALAGAAAAGVWAAQQPLDKQVFGSDYDDVELLGKFVTSESAWLPIGLAMHLQNGALFGAAYANVAALDARAGRHARSAGRYRRAPGDLARGPDRRPRAPGAAPDPRPGREPPRVLAVVLAPRAVRLRPRRARAPPQPRRRAAAGRPRRRRLHERPRVARGRGARREP